MSQETKASNDNAFIDDAMYQQEFDNAPARAVKEIMQFRRVSVLEAIRIACLDEGISPVVAEKILSTWLENTLRQAELLRQDLAQEKKEWAVGLWHASAEDNDGRGGSQEGGMYLEPSDLFQQIVQSGEVDGALPEFLAAADAYMANWLSSSHSEELTAYLQQQRARINEFATEVLKK